MGPRMANAMNRARAWLMLALVPELGPGRARRLVERFGSPEAVCALSRSALAAAGVAAAALDGWSRAGELAVRGTLEADEPAVAVVGARRASAYGRRVAEELAHGLAAAGLTVVSGLATGIDAAAHRGA